MNITVSKKTGMWLLKNRDTITSQTINGVIIITTALVGSACKILFNQHEYDMKRKVCNVDDITFTETVNYTTVLRDRLWGIDPESEKEDILKIYFGVDDNKNKGKKKQKKKDNKIGGNLYE